MNEKASPPRSAGSCDAGDFPGATDPGVLAFAAAWPAIEIDDETRSWQHAFASELLAVRDARSDEHRERIRHESHRAGGRVARGEITVDIAARTLGALVHAADEAHPVRVAWVPFVEAVTIAREAFAAGVRSARAAAA